MDTFKVLSDLFNEYQSMLHEATIELRHARNREKQLREEMDAKTLMSEEDACRHLKKTPRSIRYCREAKNMPHIRKEAEIWYIKGDIDAWLKKGSVNMHKL
ncbi:hypothetical protein [Arsenicibacter rosenii]|nr:hypothetical protein [Arsenicibacter rosenii]